MTANQVCADSSFHQTFNLITFFVHISVRLLTLKRESKKAIWNSEGLARLIIIFEGFGINMYVFASLSFTLILCVHVIFNTG